jgi:hypothetical protein
VSVRFLVQARPHGIAVALAAALIGDLTGQDRDLTVRCGTEVARPVSSPINRAW